MQYLQPSAFNFKQTAHFRVASSSVYVIHMICNAKRGIKILLQKPKEPGVTISKFLKWTKMDDLGLHFSRAITGFIHY